MKPDVKLTEMVSTSGCAAKLAPKTLHRVLESLPRMESSRLVEGFSNSEDALIYRIEGDLVCVQTVDFFPPMVDDPFTFGQVAAANALSDIYAMGCKPSVAMNLLCIPSCLGDDVMTQILRGGQSKVQEAGAVIAGGHTIADPTPKYGLCVTGFAREAGIWKNSGAVEGDVLVLTKAIGTGVINTAIKAGMASEGALREVTASMTALNRYARDFAMGLDVHGATDITGFGLLGHALEMAQASEVSLHLDYSRIPFLAEALEYARLGLLPEGLYNNMKFIGDNVEFDSELKREQRDMLYDPQTSGGLLLSLPSKDAEILLDRLSDCHASVIGTVTKHSKKRIIVSL